jgi:hypothetical protein
MLLKYVKSLNITLCTDFLNARKHVESAKEQREKEDNEEKVAEEWISYPSSSPSLRKYVLEAIIILLLSYFLSMIMFILHAIIVLSGNINACVVYEQHRVSSTPPLD